VTFLNAVGDILASTVRRRAAEEDAESTHRALAAVIEGTTDYIFVKDLDGRIIAVNASGAKALGLSHEKLIGRTIQEVSPGPLADAMAETDRLILERGTVETFEEAGPLGDETRVFLATKGPYCDRDGTQLGTFEIAHDITARKAREQEVVRSEERLRLAQEGARMGTWDVDLVTGVTEWSSGLRMLYGVDREHAADFAHFAALIHPEDRERVRATVTDASAAGVDFEFECRIIRPDGELRWLLGRSTGRRDENGDLVRILGVSIDITTRKLAEEDLVRSEALLRLAQTAGGLGAWDLNIQTDELSWTPALYEINGADPLSYQPTMESGIEYIHPDDRSALQSGLERAIASADTAYESFARIVRPSGEIRRVMNRGTIFRSADGTPTRIVGVTLDETTRRTAEGERAQLETRLRQAEKLEALGQLAGGVAHDFNNLLVAIRGYGELALGKLERGEDGVPEYVQAVLTAADRAAGLTRQLLAFGRRQVLNPEVLDLNDIVRETDGLLQQLIGDNVELVTTLAEEPVLVEVDRGMLEQVITNLALNARDAMPGGGVLRIQVTTGDFDRGDGDSPRQAVLSVADEGSGIDAAVASHIFEPFFTTKGDEGTGLGLPTVHGIVAQSGGQIVLDTAVGLGSTFSVYLPLSLEKLSSPRVLPATAGDGGTETILIVEDDPAVRSIVSKMLATRGYEIAGASNGEEAVLRFDQRESPIQLVLSDMVMLGLDGRQTIDRIREIEPTTRVLYMSGYTDGAIIRSSELGPGTGFIQKPFSGDELAVRVRELLDGASP
jgi:PAS domain S-box-containing protein